jgi:hypothetical protein
MVHLDLNDTLIALSLMAGFMGVICMAIYGWAQL